MKWKILTIEMDEGPSIIHIRVLTEYGPQIVLSRIIFFKNNTRHDASGHINARIRDLILSGFDFSVRFRSHIIYKMNMSRISYFRDKYIPKSNSPD